MRESKARKMTETDAKSKRDDEPKATLDEDE